jgi:hypothetical protein
MKLNENDARAVDILLNGMPQESAVTAADGNGGPGPSTSGAQGADSHRPAGAMSGVNAMSEDLANRVANVDQMLRLLDYLPVDEPSEGLVQRTVQRVAEARLRGMPALPRGAVSPGAAAHGSAAANMSHNLHRSPAAGGDEDAATP